MHNKQVILLLLCFFFLLFFSPAKKQTQNTGKQCCGNCKWQINEIRDNGNADYQGCNEGKGEGENVIYFLTFAV